MRQQTTPPVTAPTCEHTFPGRPSQVRLARVLIAAFLRGCPGADDAILLTSELCTNAIAHSASGQPGGTFTVRARRASTTRVYTEVEDQGSTWDGDLTGAKAPHGLFLLQSLSDSCGTRAGTRGWIMWFALGVTQPGTEGARL